MENHAKNMHQKLVPDSFLILVNNPKKPLHARNSIKNEIILKRIMKKLSSFFLLNKSLLMDKVIKNKRTLELVTTSLQNKF